MSVFNIVTQILVMLIPLLVGAVLGGLAGYAIAAWLRKRIQSRMNLRRRLLLIPWRSVLVMLPFLSFFMPRYVGMSAATGMMAVGSFALLVSIFLTANTFLSSWFPLPLKIRLLALLRIFSVAAIGVVTASGMIGGFAASMGMLQGLKDIQYTQFYDVFMLVFVVSLLIDVLIGVIQHILFRPQDVSTASVNA